MKALKSTLAKTALADPVTKQQLREYVAARVPTVIEAMGKRYRLARYNFTIRELL